MVNENLTDRRYITTAPFAANDPPRFGQLIESAKDAFVSELKNYFDYKTSDASYKISETPNIQKFELGASTPTERSFQETVNLIIAHADTLDKFPMIAVTSSTLRERKLGLGGFVDRVQYPPSIISTEKGPFNLTDGWTLQIKTWPSGYQADETVSTIKFSSILFADISNVTNQELVDAINKSQALYYQMELTSDGYIRISTGGPCAVSTPNYIEVIGGDADCLLALGFTVGQSDTYLNTANPPKNRYGLAGDMTVNIDIVTDDINTRTELCDLVHNFFTFYMEKRRFQFLGRSYQDRSINPEEWWHIIFQSQFNWSGELATPRVGGGEQYDYIYANRGSIPIFITDFIDRKLVTEPIFLLRDHVIPDEAGELPSGDYGGINWNKKINNI